MSSTHKSLDMMETVIKFNSQTSGRDKLARLIQYLSRAVWHYMQERNYNKKSIETLKNLEYNFGNFRKLLRLGRCIDVFYSTLTTINYTEPTIRLTSTLSRITNALYFLCDHILWAARAGVTDVNTDKWGKTANRYWLLSIYCNLVRDFYEIYRIIFIYNKTNCNKCGIRRFSGSSKSLSNFYQCFNLALISILTEHKDVAIDTLKNMCDVLIPLTTLGFLKLSPGTIGVLGTVSSIAGIISLVDPLSRLSPS